MTDQQLTDEEKAKAEAEAAAAAAAAAEATTTRKPRKGQVVTFTVPDAYTGSVTGSALVTGVEGDVLTLRPLAELTRVVDTSAADVTVSVVAADAVPGTYVPETAEAV